MLTGLRLGIVRGFDVVTYLADVEVEGYVGTLLHDVPVARHVAETDMNDGTSCVVALLDAFNVASAVVLGVFGGPPP